MNCLKALIIEMISIISSNPHIVYLQCICFKSLYFQSIFTNEVDGQTEDLSTQVNHEIKKVVQLSNTYSQFKSRYG